MFAVIVTSLDFATMSGQESAGCMSHCILEATLSTLVLVYRCESVSYDAYASCRHVVTFSNVHLQSALVFSNVHLQSALY